MRQFVALGTPRYKSASEGGAVCERHAQEVAMEAAALLTDAEPVIVDWLMKRNCSVTPRQFVGFYVSLTLASTAIALLLVAQGAWLVAPFTGVELLVVGIAFVIHARHAVDYERIRLYPNRLVIEQASAERLSQFEFNPRWVRVEPGASPRDPITLVSRGQAVAVGQHLACHRRAQFADDLRARLARCA
jgi:uncharacterized membrane protein